MKYFLLMSAFALTACTTSSPRESRLTYEVMCPMSMLLAKVDTITGYHYYYTSSSLTIRTGPSWREYPNNCVVSTINDGGVN
jgi:hypothetical protein